MNIGKSSQSFRVFLRCAFLKNVFGQMSYHTWNMAVFQLSCGFSLCGLSEQLFLDIFDDKHCIQIFGLYHAISDGSLNVFPTQNLGRNCHIYMLFLDGELLCDASLSPF